MFSPSVVRGLFVAVLKLYDIHACGLILTVHTTLGYGVKCRVGGGQNLSKRA